jgi:hypothetical protein
LIDLPYLRYALSEPSLISALQCQAKAATKSRERLKPDDLLSARISIPSVADQRRIVCILDKQMEAVEQARTAARAQLEWAKCLFAEWLRAVFESPETRRWPPKRLGEVLTLRNEIIHPRDNPAGPATFVGLEHIESSSGRRTGSLPLEMSLLTGRKPRFCQGDIVYGYLRPYLNKVWIAEFNGLCSVDQYVYSIKPEQVDARFVAWFMRSATFLNRAPVGQAPAWLPRIRIEEVAATEINLPALEDQRRVATMLEEQMATIARIRKKVEEQMDAINELPAAFVRRALNGDI